MVVLALLNYSQDLCSTAKFFPKYTVKRQSSTILQYATNSYITLHKTDNINCSLFANCNDAMQHKYMVVENKTPIMR